MRPFITIGMILVVNLCIVIVGAQDTEPANESSPWAFRVETSLVDFSFTTVQLRIDGAVGVGEGTASTWIDISPLSLISSAFGAALSIQHDWLAFDVKLDRRQDISTLAVLGRAIPPAWILIDGTPTVLADLGLTISSTVFGLDPRQEIALSPQLTGVFSVNGILAKPTLSLDIALGSAAIAPAITQARLSSVVDLGTVILTSTVSFERAFEAFKSLSLALSLPESGWMITGSWIPLSADTSIIRIAVRTQWGDVSLLPSQTGDPGQICTGDVCF